jgi:hypothetical protein
MSCKNEIVDLIKQMRGKIIEFITTIVWVVMRRLRVYENIFVFQRHGICTSTTIGVGCLMIQNKIMGQKKKYLK